MAATTAPDVTTVDLMTVQEKLLLSQAVYKLGAVSWAAVSKLLIEHPCCASRPAELFSPEACEKAYIALMTSIGQNVPAEDAMRPQAKVHLRLAQTFYIQRMQELKDAIEAQESKFQILMTEINALRSGEMDAELLGELRGILSNKYGKKNLDAWVPEPETVKAALVDEKPAFQKADIDMVDASPEDSVPAIAIEVEDTTVPAADADVAQAEVVAVMASPEPVPGIEVQEELGVVAAPDENDEQATNALDEPTGDDDENKPVPDSESEAEAPASKGEAQDDDIEPATASKAKPKTEPTRPSKSTRRTTKARSVTPVPPPSPVAEEHAESPARSELSPAPGSDLSPAPSPSPVKDEAPSRGTKRKSRPSSKAAAAAQPPAKTRAPRGGAAAAVAAASPASTTVPDSEMTSDAGEDEDDSKTRSTRATRGRKGKQAPSNPVSSPPPRARGSSPPAPKRGASVSSQGTEEPAQTPRTSRRTAKDRKPADNASKLSIVSNTVEDEEDEEDVKEEEGEMTEPEKTTRSSDKKKKKAAPAAAVETPVATRTSGRRESARVARKDEDEVDNIPERASASATPDVAESAGLLQPPRATRSLRQSSPRDVKSNQKFIYSLFETISQHRNGNIFQNPIKKSDAPDYYEIIKRPMDLKTIKGRIREGQISTIEEFERDLFLMLSNAMMYNAPGSHIHEMAKEMLEESESVITQFRSLQHYR